jgi:3-dehydroquinate dehydratase II
MKILILNGPNLNLLGTREPEIYGRETLDDIKTLCKTKAKALGASIDFKQSNHEGELIDWIQQAKGRFDGILINAGAYTHTSLAIHDALKAVALPVAEVHLSDPKKREAFRHFSYIEAAASVHVAGQGAAGYAVALEKLISILKS